MKRGIKWVSCVQFLCNNQGAVQNDNIRGSRRGIRRNGRRRKRRRN
jgi:hypothetical protein